jgi:hypothetical protein
MFNSVNNNMNNRMDSSTLHRKISFADFSILSKAAVVGFLLAETWYFSQAVAQPLAGFVTNWPYEYKSHALLALYVALIPIILFYLKLRGAYSASIRLLRSWRLDLLAMLMIGALVSISFSGIGTTKYKALISCFSPIQVSVLLALPIALCLLLLLRSNVIRFTIKPSNNSSFFISDIELKTAEQDLLGFKDDAARFATRLLNGGSPESMVFGIDSPWGIGKSTFVNFCVEHLERTQKDRIIIYKFDPLRYENRSNLAEKFIDGLVHTIRKQVFLPEIQPLVSRYSRFIKGKVGIHFLGFKFDPSPYDIDDALDDLESALSGIDRKIIVIVDDLDRLGFSAIKDVLFAIKKSFTLPNVSYVLCYDTENILALEKRPDDAEKVREFLEKFVNVKISLFLDTHVLAQYVSENFKKVVQSNLLIDPLTLAKIKEALDVLQRIYKSTDFHHYQLFLSDIRKLKRLINTVMLFEIETTDFENSDFNKRDLLHLLLIYINYPNIFRKIYNTETDGKAGFFSVIRRGDPNYPPEENNGGQDNEKNSTLYTEYLGSLREEGQRFLLKRIFSFPDRFNDSEDEEESALSDEAKRSTFACFNGIGGARNLEAHLKLIIRLSKPQTKENYKFYLAQKKKILDGTPIREVLSGSEFSPSNGEEPYQQFWRVVANSAREFRGRTGDGIIDYLLDHIQEHSLLEIEKIGIGFRASACYRIIKLLDVLGYVDESGGHVNNTNENVLRIAERILGEAKYAGKGVLETLAQTDRGPIGLFDLMLFRLQCSADRGGDIHNVTRALSLHESPDNPTSGLVVIAVAGMREISQRVFKIFDDQYITTRKNLFDAIDHLSLDDFTGKFHVRVSDRISSGDVSKEDVERAVAATKSRMKGFITYQLANSFISSGVGCGYYDETGREDKHGIAKRVNDYLFNECFGPAGGLKNYEHFLDYLLMNLASTFMFENDEHYTHRARIEAFTKVLDKEELAQYWEKNEKAIRALNLVTSEKVVHTLNYSASYKERLNEVFGVLDQLLPPKEQEHPAN